MKKNRKGFTLIEMAIVVCILGALTLIAMPSFRAAKITNNETVAKNNLRQLANAFEQYFLFDGALTYPDTMQKVSGYVDSRFMDAEVNGYQFQIDRPTLHAFTITAFPTAPGITGNKSFSVSQGAAQVEELPSS